MSRILPRPTALSQPYWDGAREGVLLLQHCIDCDEFQFYPRIICSSCGGASLDWQASSGKGTVASFTIVRRGISADYPAPYVVALIDLQEGPRMMSSLVDVAAENVRVGLPVAVTFTDWSDDIAVPEFRPLNNSIGEFP